MSSTDEYDERKREIGQALRSLNLRPPLPADVTSRLVDTSHPLDRPARATIFGPDDTHHFSYVLTKGRVRVMCTGHHGEPLVIQVVGPGRVFGIEWLPTMRRRLIGAVAETDIEAGLIGQDGMTEAFGKLGHRGRLGVQSFTWRSLSALVVTRAAVRALPAPDRLRSALRTYGRDVGERTPDGFWLVDRLTVDGMAALSGAAPDTVKKLRQRLFASGELVHADGRLLLRIASPAPRHDVPRHGPYRGVPATWARGYLEKMLDACNHLGLNGQAKDVIRRYAGLFEVPAGELLLPPDSEEAVAFIVRGSAWLEGVGREGESFTLQLLAPGRFVRLPTGPSAHDHRLWGRAHRDCVVAILTLEQMAEVIAAMTDLGSLTLLAATCRDLSRHLCDSTTAPTRTLDCRIVQAFMFLAHDFHGRPVDDGIFVDVPLTEADIGRLTDVGPAAVAKALGRLIGRGWLARVAPQRYVLLKLLPSREQSASFRCPLCNPEH